MFATSVCRLFLQQKEVITQETKASKPRQSNKPNHFFILIIFADEPPPTLEN